MKRPGRVGQYRPARAVDTQQRGRRSCALPAALRGRNYRPP